MDFKEMTTEERIKEYTRLLVQKEKIDGLLSHLIYYVKGENGNWLVEIDGGKFCLKVADGRVSLLELDPLE